MNPGWLLQEIGRAIGSSIRDTFSKQMHPDDGKCPEWLAVFLGVAGLAFLFTLVVHGFWSISK